VDTEHSGPGEGVQADVPPGGGRPAPAQPWHRTPMEPEGPPPWTSSRPGERVFGAEGAPQAGGDAPADPAPGADAGEASAPPPPGPPAGSAPPPPASVPPPAAPPAAPPGEPPPTAVAPGGAVAPGPRTGGSLARGIFLFLGAASLVSGLGSVLAAKGNGGGLAAAVLGVAFAVTFFVALMLRPGTGLDPVRATLGVLSILFLVGCFSVAVGLGDQGPVPSSTGLVRGAVGAGLFTFGMAGVGMLIPSGVAAGFAMAGLVVTVELAAAAAGVENFGLAVAGLVAGVVALELAFRVPRLRAHPAAGAWMVNIAALFTGLAATALAFSFQGTAIAAAGLTGAALAVVAWRWHAVVAAVVAALALSMVEGYIVVNAVGGDSAAEGVVVLLVGLVILLLVGVLGMRARGEVGQAGPRRFLPDELLLVAAAAVALIALSEVGGGFGGLPHFPFGSSFGSSAAPSFQPIPRGPTPFPLPTFRTFRPVPTFPTFPPFPSPPPR
jgi:hypothetical protein